MPALDEHLNGLWYVLRSGAAWRALPDVFGKWGAIHQYFNRLSHAGFFDWLHEKLVLGSDAEVVFGDSTCCKVHQHASGGQGHKQECIGKTRGGLNTKVHAVCDGLLRLAAKLVITAGNVSDFPAAPQLHASLRNCVVVEDKGFDSKAVRADLRSRGCEPCIPSRKNTRRPEPYNEYLYKARHCIENLFQKMKRFRRIATRYEKTSRMFIAMLLVSVSAIYERNGFLQPM